MKKILVGAALLAIVGGACNKPYNNNNTNPGVYGTYSSMDTIFTILNPASKFVSFDANLSTSFYGNSGTKYFFPAGIFVDAAGNPVSGFVQVEVKELLNKGDMIFAKALPLSGTDELVSGGEVYVNATQAGQQVYIRAGGAYQASIPQGRTPVTGMSFFKGTPDNSQPNNVVQWKPSDSGGVGTVVYNGDSITIISDSLHWANADQFMTNPNYQDFTVSLSMSGGGTLPAASAIFTYALYDNYKAFWPMGTMGTLSGYSNGTISEHHVPNIPVHFASFCIVNGRFYGGVVAAKPVTNGHYTILLTQVDPVAFKGQLNSLIN